MKQLVNILFILMFCITFAQAQTKAKTSSTSKPVLKTLTCSAGTRGYQEEIIINEKTVSIHRNERGVSRDTSFSITKKDWQSLCSSVSKMSMSKISTYKAPTNLSATDAALSQQIKIETNKATYSVPGFDKGHPHPKVKSLANKISKICGM